MNIQQFNYQVDILQAILWQYSDATRLVSLLDQKQSWYDENHSFFWVEWHDNVFNLATANLFGLSVWSYILQLPLYVPSEPFDPTKPYWGFGAYNQNFHNANFAPYGGGAELTIEEQRFVLRLRYFQLVSRGAIASQAQGSNPGSLIGTNEMLNYLVPQTYPDGRIWVLDGLNMSITYVFNFTVPPDIRDILVEQDLLPRPAGVGIKYVNISEPTFGFGPYNQNFSNGNFVQEF
jgi:hypothetical protein